MGQNYDKLDIVKFGRQLLETNDLDPVYVALQRLLQTGIWGNMQVYRWLVAYWCFYDCGMASALSTLEGEKYWLKLAKAALNESKPPVGERWPRSSERRHFRGKQATSAVAYLRQRYKYPEDMVSYLIGENDTSQSRTFKEVCARAREHLIFGPWIGFKIADMLDRVLGVPVDFDEAAIFMFKDPVKAVVMLWQQKTGYTGKAKPKDLNSVIHQTVAWLTDEFKEFKAPPLYDRPVDLQEVETILCKWKSHMNGHYPLLKDSTEIKAAVASWAVVSKASKNFLENMPK